MHRSIHAVLFAAAIVCVLSPMEAYAAGTSKPSHDGMGKGSGTINMLNSDQSGFSCTCTALDPQNPTATPTQGNYPVLVTAQTVYTLVEADGETTQSVRFAALVVGDRVIVSPSATNPGIAGTVVIQH
ncbi:MAG: hypothetical protein ABSD74_08495 [Rhizomicrobium sp.]|jgi:hypothetical protein